MLLEHTFTVPVGVDEAWRVLLDLPRVAPCMPGATLTTVDDDGFTGTVKVKLGPIALTYQGKGRFVQRDEATHRVIIEASGRDARAAGTASAVVTAVLVPDGGATQVQVATELSVTGRPAQFGRGMLADVSGKLIGQFADCLAETLAPAAPAPTGSTGAATSVAGPPAPGPGGAGSSDASSSDASSSNAGSSDARAPGAGTSTAGTSDAGTSAAGTSGAGTSGVGAGRAGAPAAAAASGEAEPIDVLRLTAGSRTIQRYGLVALLASAGAVLLWLLRRRRP